MSAKGKPPGLLLAPGAGAGADQPALVAIDEEMTARGWRVWRMDFPYRLAGRRAPDRQPLLVRSLLDNAERLAEGTAGQVLGGRSMGGRIASVATAEGFAARALVLISYPLHPPGKPDRLRVDHFPGLRPPCLFVSGTRDAFGTVEEMESATAAIPGPVTHEWIEGKDHSLRGCETRVAELVSGWLLDLPPVQTQTATSSVPRRGRRSNQGFSPG